VEIDGENGITPALKGEQYVLRHDFSTNSPLQGLSAEQAGVGGERMKNEE